MYKVKSAISFGIFLLMFCLITSGILSGSAAEATLEIHPQAGPPGTTLTIMTSESSFPSGATVTFYAVLGAPILITVTSPTVLSGNTLAVEVPPLQMTFAGQRVNYAVRVNNPDGTLFDELAGGNFSPTGPGILLARVNGQTENSNTGASLNLNPGDSVNIIANFYSEPDSASSGCGLLLDFPVTFYSTDPSAVSVTLLTSTVSTAYPPVPPGTNTDTASLTQDAIVNSNSLGINDYGAIAKVTALTSSPADIVVEVPVASVGLGDGSCPLGSSVGTGGAAVVIFPINGGQGTTAGKGGVGSGGGAGGGGGGVTGCTTSTVTGPPDITPAIDAGTLAQSLFGTLSGTLASGTTITGASFSGANGSAGTYGQGILGIGDGIVLSTGCVGDIPGSNDSDSQSGSFLSAGDSRLDTLSGGTTYDAAVFKVDFDAGPSTNSISFDIIFGSEEYSEFVGSAFNDAFGIFLNDTQIAFDQVNRPITVNGGLFASGIAVTDTGTELDGSTPRLTITAPVSPGSTGNTLVFAIADTADEIYDSAVFVAAAGSSSTGLTIGIETNQGSYQGGDTLVLGVNANNPGSSDVLVDALVSVTLPDGSRFFLASDYSFSDTVNPFASNVTVPAGFTLPSTTIFTLQLPPGLPEGIYNWQVQLVQPGTEIPISNIASTLVNISP
jgi:hypothetical protein